MKCAVCKQPVLEGQALKLQSVVQHQNPTDCVAATARRCAEMLETEGVFLSIMPGETGHEKVVRYARAMATKIRREFPAAFVTPEVK